jgi:hypothetical protein
VQEDESIRALEFQSRQRMWALEQEASKSALQVKLRDEASPPPSRGPS